MTPVLAPAQSMTRSLDFDLRDDQVASSPIEAGGRRRDETRLLATWRSRPDRMVEATFADLPRFLVRGDVLVVNTSGTLPAAVPTTDGRVLHLSTELADGLWVVELRRPWGTGSLPLLDASPGPVGLPGGASLELLGGFGVTDPSGTQRTTRLWTARLDTAGPLPRYLARHGRPIRYRGGHEAWPLSAYQSVFARDPGSAEMASAGRGFTTRLVTELVGMGVVFAPVVLHTGVSSQEAGEAPYPERYEVRPHSAELVNAARSGGRRVVAVGTTATRALETVVGADGLVRPGRGWTDVVVTPQRGVRAVDGIITGWHEPRASHLALLEAVAGRELLERSYRRALAAGFLWHEFGDFHLVLP